MLSRCLLSIKIFPIFGISNEGVVRLLSLFIVFLIALESSGQKIETTYYDDGALMEYKEFVEGDLVLYSAYYPSGQLMERGVFSKGKPHGEWERFNEKGQVTCSAFYRDGNKEGAWFFRIDGGALFTQVDYVRNEVMDYNIVDEFDPKGF
jgi:hypothetical protein